MAFTEAVGTETDLLVLASQAIAVLRDRFPDAGLGYYTAEGDLWKARVWAEDMDRQLVRTMTAGLPGSTPLIRQAVASRTPVFTEAWEAGQQEIEYSGAYGAGSAYPLLLGGEVHALLLTGLRGTRQWSEADRALIRAVGRSLNLVLRRVAAAQQLQLQKEAAESRARALEAFARLSRDLVTETDRYALIRQAQGIVLSLLPPGAAVYYELTGGLWRVRAQVGEIGNARLQAVLDAGLPLEVPTLHTPWTTGEPFYQDEYAQGSDTSAEIIRQVNASAALLLRRAGQPIGVFTIGLFDQRVWTPVDRSVLGTVIQSLELALERAQNVEVLAERTAELEWANQELHLSNQELEAFTYSASHDLRTPVRHVRGFTEMAGRALDAGDSVRVRRHHGVVLAAADRMTDLIDAMLVLSRAGRAPVHRREVPLAALVSQAQRDVRLEFPEQPVSWRLGALPGVNADPQLLQQVLTNLLSNAVKYGQGREPLTVEVWAEERPGEVQVFVRDNGVGFDPRYTDKLFGVFQRLHRQEEFQGTGVGLATVRRLVTRHGGRVWAEGRLDRGATFGFSLPR